MCSPAVCRDRRSSVVRWDSRLRSTAGNAPYWDLHVSADWVVLVLPHAMVIWAAAADGDVVLLTEATAHEDEIADQACRCAKTFPSGHTFCLCEDAAAGVLALLRRYPAFANEEVDVAAEDACDSRRVAVLLSQA